MSNKKNEVAEVVSGKVEVFTSETEMCIERFKQSYGNVMISQRNSCVCAMELYNMVGRKNVNAVLENLKEKGLIVKKSNFFLMVNAGELFTMQGITADYRDLINQLPSSTVAEMSKIKKLDGKYCDNIRRFIDIYEEELDNGITQKEMREFVKEYIEGEIDEDGNTKDIEGKDKNDTVTAETSEMAESSKDSEWAVGFIDYLINSYEFDSDDLQSLEYLKKLV